MGRNDPSYDLLDDVSVSAIGPGPAPRRLARQSGTSLPPSHALTPGNEPPPELPLALGEAIGIGGPQSVPGVGRTVSTQVLPEAALTGLSTSVGGDVAAIVWESADIRSRQIVDEAFATELKMNADLDSLLTTQLVEYPEVEVARLLL